jgi:Homocysteine S-methyltransferase
VEDVYRTALPQLSDEVFLTDSGLETDLIFHGGFDLPEFAAFVLVDDARGIAALEAYFRRHVDIAVQHGCGVILEAPTWRASRDWGSRIGYPPAELRRVNQSAVGLLSWVRGDYRDAATSPVVISGCIGPRADGYRPAEHMPEDEAEDYHQEQIEVLAATDADLVHGLGLHAAASGDPGAALHYLAGAVTRSRPSRGGHLWSHVWALTDAARLGRHLGDPRHVGWQEEALATAQRCGMRALTGQLLQPADPA